MVTIFGANRSMSVFYLLWGEYLVLSMFLWGMCDTGVVGGARRTSPYHSGDSNTDTGADMKPPHQESVQADLVGQPYMVSEKDM